MSRRAEEQCKCGHLGADHLRGYLQCKLCVPSFSNRFTCQPGTCDRFTWEPPKSPRVATEERKP